jgi:adenylate cyclase
VDEVAETGSGTYAACFTLFKQENSMGIEIERKFLVHPEFLPVETGDGVQIIQGYLSEQPSIRFRIIGPKIIITIKRLNNNGTRFELETAKESVSLEEQTTLKSLAIYPVIEKIRYKIPYSGLIWEVDVYQGDNLGLVTADVELPSLDYPIHFPQWIDSSVELTHDPRYFNINLGRDPMGQWKK